MASKSKISFVGIGFLLCSFVALVMVIMQEHSDCVTGHGYYYGGVDKQSRKLLSGKEVAKATGVHATSSNTEKGQNMMGTGSELRMAPSGPDPLHHNDNPKNKKPQSP